MYAKYIYYPYLHLYPCMPHIYIFIYIYMYTISIHVYIAYIIYWVSTILLFVIRFVCQKGLFVFSTWCVYIYINT